MEITKNVLLPGLHRQFNFLLEAAEIQGKKGLVVGSESGAIASALAEKTGVAVEVIVEDYHSLMNSKLSVEGDENVEVKLMNFAATDYSKETFDLIYAQASTGTFERNAIAKEVKRIIKPDGIFCAGELTLKDKSAPPFVLNMFDGSGLDPLVSEELKNYWESRGWELTAQIDLSKSLGEFYQTALKKLNAGLSELSDREKSYNKSLINQISHDSNVYTKLGGSKFIGFDVLLLRKK